MFVVQTRRNAPFIFAPPCQSELKRTLKPGGDAENTVHSRGFRSVRDPHLTRMVNDRFPAGLIYGFEMVDAADGSTFACFPSSMEYLRRIKSFGFIANFRCLYLNANTCGLSSAVSQESTCGMPATEPRRDDRDREMFFPVSYTHLTLPTKRIV